MVEILKKYTTGVNGFFFFFFLENITGISIYLTQIMCDRGQGWLKQRLNIDSHVLLTIGRTLAECILNTLEL